MNELWIVIDEDERSEKVGGDVDEVHVALAPSSPAHSSPALLPD